MTRRGKPVAVLLSISEYNRLKEPQKRPLEDLYRFRENFDPDEDCFEGLRDQ